MLKIGEFSKLSRVSVRMLRHYDEIGLLPPASIDSATGYRYYSEDQLPVAGRITALRDMGFGLGEIQACQQGRENPQVLAALFSARLSFLMGNYITLTNLSRRELQRICDLHISPINISVHATDPAVRRLLLGNQRRGGECLEIMEQFARAGIVMNCQIVACPGLNDGGVLQRSMEDLAALYPQVKSVSVVPVGLTRYRKGLYPLRPYTVAEAREVVGQVEAYGARCLEEKGSRIFWCSDEFYLQGELPLPEDAFYEAYTQLENGVGMLRLLEVELNGAALGAPQNIPVAPFSIATGVAAAPFLREIIDRAAAKCHTKLDYQIYPIVNHFFGETITVAGLLTGQDLLAQLRGKDLGTRVLLPQNTLRHGETVFLDDMTLEELSQGLGVPVVPVNQDGFDLFEAVFGV